MRHRQCAAAVMVAAVLTGCSAAASAPGTASVPAGSSPARSAGASPSTTPSATTTTSTSDTIAAAVRGAGLVVGSTVHDLDRKPFHEVLGRGVLGGHVWHEPGFPRRGVPALSRSSQDVKIIASGGRTVWMNVLVTSVPDGIPAKARPCSVDWLAPYTRQLVNPCHRRPDLGGLRRADREFSNLAISYAWDEHVILEVSFRGTRTGDDPRPLAIGHAARVKILRGLVPLVAATAGDR